MLTTTQVDFTVSVSNSRTTAQLASIASLKLLLAFLKPPCVTYGQSFHRDPLQIMGSSVNILKALWWMRSEKVDPELIQASFAGEGLAARLFAALDYRDGGESDPGQFRDVRFSDLMKDPIATLNSVYEWLEMDLSPEIEKAMLDYLQAKPRGKHGKHEYTFSELGLDLKTERDRFLDYQARFNVPSEIT